MKFINSKNIPAARGHYSQAVWVEGLLYVAAQLSLDPETGKPCAGGVREHTLQALQNVERILKDAGLERKHVVNCRVYTPKIENLPEIDAVFEEFFNYHRPVRTVVPTGALEAGCLVQIEVVADLP